MLTLDRLKYFRTLAETEHVGRAAKICHISPSVISSAISVLEAELSYSLFDKEKKRLRLNENGRLFLEKVDKILIQVDDLYSNSELEKQNVRGRYTIEASPILMKEFFLKSYSDVTKSNQNLVTELRSQDTGVILSNINSGLTDFALVFKSMHYTGIDEHLLYEGKFYICVNKNHPILKYTYAKRVDMLNNLPAITFKSSTGPSIYEEHPELKKLGIIPLHHFFYNNNDISIKLLELTDGWALLPDIVYKKYESVLKVVKLKKNYEIPMKISLVKSKDRPSFTLFEMMKKTLSDQFSSTE